MSSCVTECRCVEALLVPACNGAERYLRAFQPDTWRYGFLRQPGQIGPGGPVCDGSLPGNQRLLEVTMPPTISTNASAW